MNDQIETLEHAMEHGAVIFTVRYRAHAREYRAHARPLGQDDGVLGVGDSMLGAMVAAFSNLYPEGNTER